MLAIGFRIELIAKNSKKHPIFAELIIKFKNKNIMTTIAQQFGMNEALEILGIKAINQGTSTGSNWFSNGEKIDSFSPVDGQLIGSVTTTTREDYEKVMQTATAAFKIFRTIPAPK